jgi:N-acyl-D-aspartate/D-glutamate deacylase
MTEFDLVLRGGTIVDGSGRPPRTGDIGVHDGTVVAVGTADGRARRELDVSGSLVTPGFVDVHTHYDGQATWDSRLSPSSWNGVTTVVMGNCGVGFAPVRSTDHDRLIELMEGVEDIPGTALHEGLQWDWSTFPEYLDALERRPHDVDFAAQVPHAALRVHVMGERAVAHAAATEAEIAVMAEAAGEAISAGAVGFSSSRTLNHKSRQGELIPSYGAGADELRAIAAAIGATGRGVLQLITDFIDVGTDFEIIEGMLRAARRPMSVSLLQSRDRPEGFRAVLGFIAQMNAQGHQLRGQAASRAVGTIHGLGSSLHPFMMNPVWRSELAHLPWIEQARRMADPRLKSRILESQTTEKDLSRGSGVRIDRWDMMYALTDPPAYEPNPAEDSIAAMSRRSGRSPEDLAYDLLIADDGRGLIYQPFQNYADGNLGAVREMLIDEYTIPGLSDGGAHVGTICDASFVTSLLQYWVRDREHGRLDLSFVVRRQARETAGAVGLLDRGLLAPGYKADINVIDLAALALRRPEIHADLPAGGRRLLQRVDGILHTFVSGIETYSDGEHTGELPGRLVRGPRADPATATQIGCA